MSTCYVPDRVLSKEDIKLSKTYMLDTDNSFPISFLPFFLTKRIPVLLKVAFLGFLF